MIIHLPLIWSINRINSLLIQLAILLIRIIIKLHLIFAILLQLATIILHAIHLIVHLLHLHLHLTILHPIAMDVIFHHILLLHHYYLVLFYVTEKLLSMLRPGLRSHSKLLNILRTVCHLKLIILKHIEIIFTAGSHWLIAWLLREHLLSVVLDLLLLCLLSVHIALNKLLLLLLLLLRHISMHNILLLYGCRHQGLVLVVY